MNYTGKNVNELRSIIANEIVSKVNSIDVTKQKTTNDILLELTKSIGQIDFMLLAFPKIEELQQKYFKLELELFGKIKEAETIERIYTDNESNEYKEAFKQWQNLGKELSKCKLTKNHYLILCVEKLLELANAKKWDLCKNEAFIYLYNGFYWNEISKELLQSFLGKTALKMGVEKFKAKIFTFQDELFKQFMVEAYFPKPEPKPNSVLINLQNGTFEISPQGTKLRPFDRSDFITYQLPFEYNPQAKAPLFEAYLNKVLPDLERQRVLAEYLGYVFIKHGGRLKLEAALILYGTGANGKSVFFEIVTAMFGRDNVSNYSLQSLTEEKGFYRAKIANKLVNYASEINGKLETSLLKAMVSGEPVEACLKYGQPFTMTDYAKFIFNCNELPKEVEHTNAYFRRWLIIPFDVTIPKAEQDSELHIKIIEKELSGVFNWVLQGLNRLLEQRRFSDCEAIENARSDYEKQSDSVQIFINEFEFKTSTTDYTLIKTLYEQYKVFCIEDGFRPVNKSNFMKRLTAYKIYVTRLNVGNVAYIVDNNDFV